MQDKVRVTAAMRAAAVLLVLLVGVMGCGGSGGSSNSTDSQRATSSAAARRGSGKALATPGTAGSARLVKAPVQVVSGRTGGPEGYVEVTIHGKPFLFLIDSGASETVIEARVVGELNLQTVGPARRASKVGCTTPYRPVKIDDWAIGSDRLPSGTVTSIDLQSPNQTLNGLPLGGLLGQDLFDSYGTLTLDFTNRAMTLGGPAPPGGKAVPLDVRRHQGAIFSTTTVTINGHAETMVPDTGSPHTLLDTKVADQLHLQAGRLPVREVGGPCPLSETPTVFDHWSAGAVLLPTIIGVRADAHFHPTDAKLPELEGLIGTDALATFGTLTFDYTTHRLLLKL